MNQHYFVNYTFLGQISFQVLYLALFACLICLFFYVEKPSFSLRLKYEKVQSGLEKGNAKASAVFSLPLKLYAICLDFCPPPRCNSNCSTLGENRNNFSSPLNPLTLSGFFFCSLSTGSILCTSTKDKRPNKRIGPRTIY